MPESDERSGLAKSIDALFSQPRPTAPTEEPAAEGPEGRSAAEMDAASSLPTEATPPPPEDADGVPPLPVEAGPPPSPEESAPPPLPSQAPPPPLPVPASPPPLPRQATPPPLPTEETRPPLPEPTELELAPEEAPLDRQPEEEVAPPPPANVPVEPDPFEPLDAPPLEMELTSEPNRERGETPQAEAPSVPPPAAELMEAVDAFLAGHPGAAAKVERIAAEMRERLALDPLADAAERLVHAADEDDDDPAIELARKIVNPAVASRLVQRMSHEEEEDARAEYLELSRRLGMVMANAFKGALTDATDKPTRRACYDGLIGLGDTSRPVIEAMVEDDNRFLVQNAIAILGEVGGDRALELVTSALANTDPRVRREALSALAKLGDDDSGQLVLASLEDPNEKVRATAAEAAGRLGVARALRPMLALLDDDELGDEEHVQVLRGLGHLGDPGAVQAIEKRAVGSLFSKPATEVRVAAYRALHDIGTPHARELIAKAADDKDPVVRTTVKALGQEA